MQHVPSVVLPRWPRLTIGGLMTAELLAGQRRQNRRELEVVPPHGVAEISAALAID
jgi:hypothetical protein